MLPTPSAVVVEVAVTDEHALIGFGDAFVRRVLELEEADSLAAQPRFSEAVAELGGPENAGLTWVDLAGTREAIDAAFGPELQVFAQGYESEVRPWLLPLDRIVSVARLEGDVLLQRAMLLVE